MSELEKARKVRGLVSARKYPELALWLDEFIAIEQDNERVVRLRNLGSFFIEVSKDIVRVGTE